MASAPVVNPQEVAFNAGAALSRTFEERARELLERYVPSREFQVSANVTPSGRPLPRAPYEPKAVTSGASLNMTFDELDPYVGRVQIEILLSNRLKTSQKRLEDLLFKVMKLKKNRGDRIAFDALGIEIDSEEWQKEKAELKQELALLKAENDRLNREKAKGTQAKTLSEEEWFWPAVIGGACFILLLGLLAMGGGLYSAGKNLGSAVNTVANSMTAIGGAISHSGEGQGGGGLQSLEAKLLPEGKKGGGLSNLPIESLHAHLLKMRHELLENLSEGTEAILLKHLTNLTASPTTVARAVMSLEVLGREMATELFRRLGQRSQEEILTFMRSGAISENKIELMLEAAEEMKTKLLVESLDRIRGKPNERIAQRLLQLNIEEAAGVAAELDVEYLPRLFLYLDPPQIAKVMLILKRTRPDKYTSALNQLGKMPEASTNEGFDSNIEALLDSTIEKTRADFQRPFLKVYQDIVSSADQEISEQIVRELSQNDPRIDKFFRESVISIHSLFQATPELREEIVEGLSNREIAGLATGINEDEREALFAAVAQRRKALVDEEYESLMARGGRQAQEAFKKVRESLVKRLTQLKADGVLVLTGTAAPTAPGPKSFTGLGKEPTRPGPTGGGPRKAPPPPPGKKGPKKAA